MPEPTSTAAPQHDIDRLLKAIAVECALHFAEEGQDAATVALTTEVWAAALLAPQAAADLTSALINALKRERERRLAHG